MKEFIQQLTTFYIVIAIILTSLITLSSIVYGFKFFTKGERWVITKSEEVKSKSYTENKYLSDYYNLIGHTCSGIGICGQTKDILIVGKLLYFARRYNTATILDEILKIPCTVNLKTLKEVKEY